MSTSPNSEDFPRNETGHKHVNANFFKPIGERRLRYDLYIVWTKDSGPLEGRIGGRYREGLSEMADATFHELLHVWFVHQFPNVAGQYVDLGHSGGLNHKEFAKLVHRIPDADGRSR